MTPTYDDEDETWRWQVDCGHRRSLFPLNYGSSGGNNDGNSRVGQREEVLSSVVE